MASDKGRIARSDYNLNWIVRAMRTALIYLTKTGRAIELILLSYIEIMLGTHTIRVIPGVIHLQQYPVIVFLPVDYKDVLYDIEKASQYGNCDLGLMKSAPEVVELGCVVPYTATLKAGEELCVLYQEKNKWWTASSTLHLRELWFYCQEGSCNMFPLVASLLFAISEIKYIWGTRHESIVELLPIWIQASSKQFGTLQQDNEHHMVDK